MGWDGLGGRRGFDGGVGHLGAGGLVWMPGVGSYGGR